MAILSEDAKQRLEVVIRLSMKLFNYGFIPTVIYLGFKRGVDPGMPPLSPINILW